MRKFDVFDEVYHKPTGRVGTIKRWESSSGKVLLTILCTDGVVKKYWASNCILLSEYNSPGLPVREQAKLPNRSWSFKASNDLMIDFRAIAAELSYKNPIAFIEREEYDFVLIHQQLLKKNASSARLRVPTSLAQAAKAGAGCVLYVSQSRAARAEVIAWAREVKAAKFSQKLRQRETVVRVFMPEV